MLTICTVNSEADTRIIESITKDIDPAGTFRIIRNLAEAVNAIIDTDPDIVWLEASEESFIFASEKRNAN